MVAAGVTTVVAAGNESSNAANFNPANIDQVITVSALADSDGKPGGQGGPYSDACTNPQPDDSLASFSNFGADVDIAAPGVGILSTFPEYLTHHCVAASGTGYDVFPGTSMASPHVAGAAGLLLAQNPNLSPEQVRSSLLASREQVAIPGDPDGINEGVLKVGNADNKGPSVSVKGSSQVKVGQAVPLRVTAIDPSGVAKVVLYQCTPRCKVVAQDAAAPYKFVRKHQATGKIKYKVRAYDKAGNFTDKVKVITVKPKKRR
jgi:subtilisin family serine protease